MTNKDQLAFPRSGSVPEPGLTKQEYFALICLQAVITKGGYTNPVETALHYADTLLKELEKNSK
jgi:hypothetical protein